MIRARSVTAAPDYAASASRPYRWRGIPGWNPASAAAPARAPEPAAASAGVPEALPPHGTYARYRRHQRDHEKPCEPCRLANRTASQRQRAAKAATS